MAEQFSVQATLSAIDKNFTSTMNRAAQTTQSMGEKIKSGLAFGALMGIGTKAVSAIGKATVDLVKQIDQTNASWTTFSKNMQMSGMSNKKIAKTKNELQEFAAKTVYTSKDMAATYAQLYAVNNKTSAAVVKGFGAVAAAAENPTQAMKTLSQQATQMAAKPTVQWMDFKLMLEQTPAGISRVAKAMGMSTKELVKNVQDGKVKTQDFFDAMEKLSKDPSLMGMAQTYKTIGEAADGLTATLANKLAPAWKVVSGGAIKGITGIMNNLAAKMNVINKAFSGVGKTWGKAFDAIGKELGKLTGSKSALDSFKSSAESAAKALDSLGKFCEKHADTIAKLIDMLPNIAKAWVAWKAFGGIGKMIGGLGGKFGPLLTGLDSVGKAFNETKGAGEGIGETVATLGEEAATTAETTAATGASLGQSALGFIGIAGAITLAAAGFYILAQAATTLADGGPLAIGVFVGMVAGIAGLALAFATLGPELDIATPAMLAFGATVLAVGAGIALIGLGVNLACNGIATLAGSLSTIASYGAMAGAAMAVLGAGLIVAGAGAIVAGAGITVLAAGCIAGAAGILILGLAVVVLAAGMAILGAATKLVASQVKAIATSAKSAASSLKAMQSSVGIVKSGLGAIGSLATSAMNKLKSAFDTGAAAAKTSAASIGKNFSSGMKGGLTQAVNQTRTTMNSIHSAMAGAPTKAHTIGVNVGKGLAAGLRSQVPEARAAARELSDASTVTVRKRTKVRSPSRVTMAIGRYVGEGFAIGIESQKGRIATSARALADIATYRGNKLSFAGDYYLDDRYDYSNTQQISVNVVSELDGKVVSRQLAPLMQTEQNRLTTRANRKRGIR